MPVPVDTPPELDMVELNNILDKTKIQLMVKTDFLFISSVCFSLKHIFDERVPTACTNGKFIRYNPHMFKDFSPEHRLFVLLHETWHVALGHTLRDSDRFKGCDPQKLNIAMDHVINLMLKAADIQMPDWVCCDDKYIGMSTEEVYKLLPDPPTITISMSPQGSSGEGESGSGDDDSEGQGTPNHDPNAPDKMNGDIQFNGGTPEEQAEAREQLNDVLVRASIQAQMGGADPGNLPGELKVLLERLTNPKLNWRVILRRYFTAMAKNDYSFRRPNRRFFPKHHLPSTFSEALGDVAMAIDMSGSVSDSETVQFISDVYSVMATVKLKSLKLVQFDTRVFQEDKITQKTQLTKIDFRGRGGTDVEPVIEWANKNKPDVLCIFSDGYFSEPSFNCVVPVVWVIHNNPTFTAPYGKVIHYTID